MRTEPLPPIKSPNGASPYIIAELMKIRRDVHWRPCFRRGLMFFDFKAGKVRIAPVDGAAA